MGRIRPQNCPECGKKYIWFDLHWKICEKNPDKRICPQCKGQGGDRENGPFCPMCNGTGEL